MKADITSDGILTIKAETEIEAYALSRWNNESMGLDISSSNVVYKIGGSKLMIDVGLKNE